MLTTTLILALIARFLPEKYKSKIKFLNKKNQQSKTPTDAQVSTL